MRILYFDVDSMGPRHMSCYGYNRDTTPNIDQIAEKSYVFHNMHTSDAPCLPSRTALLTGQFGIHSGVVNHSGKYSVLRNIEQNRKVNHPITNDGLFGLLKRSGLNTILVSSFPERHSAFWFNSGFNEIYSYGNRGIENADEVYKYTSEWLNRNEENENWFLYVNMWDPHTPYRVPKSYGNPLDEKPFETWITKEILDEHLMMSGPKTARHLNQFDDNPYPDPEFFRALGKISNMEDLKTYMDGYDVGIHYADHYIGKICEQLKQQGIYDDTIIVVSADHGENMGELGMYSEHGTADDVTCRIPFIVKPNTSNFNRFDYYGLHYSVDIIPTVSDLLQTKKMNENYIWHGKSFIELFRNKNYISTRDHLVLSQMTHVCQRSVKYGDFIYIKTYHDGLHTRFDEEMLFNIKDDFYEQFDIKQNHPEIINKCRKLLDDWTEKRLLELPEKLREDPKDYIVENDGPCYSGKKLGKLFIKDLIKKNRMKDVEEILKKHKEFKESDFYE